MSLSEDLAWRGLIKDKTFDNINWLDQPGKFYLGIDASSDSFTIGNLAVIMLARRLIEAGWQATLLAGGATSLVGDPGGKQAERQLQSRDQIAKNIEGIKAQFETLFAGQPHQLVNNLDWLDGVKLLDFLRDTGKFYSMTELMQREFVDARMNEAGSGISYAEFSYSLLQGYDYWHLYKNMQVGLQVGASDQWGNMLSGVALIRKKDNAQVQAFSMPLVVNKQTGVKFGKSEAGAIWLDPAKTSPAQFYQFWINATDNEVEEYLKVFTLLSKNEIEQVMAQQHSDPAERAAQKRLAEEVTKIVHGNDGIEAAKSYSDMVSDGNLEAQPAIKLPDGVGIVQALISTGLASSNTEARRLVDEKGVYINNEPFDKDTLQTSDFDSGKLLLRKGKKLQNSALIELE